MNTNTVLTQASREWASRPDDQRFLSLTDLKAAVDQRKAESWTTAPRVKDIRVLAPNDSDLEIVVNRSGDEKALTPTHHGFSQFASYAGAPPSYLRKLPAQIAAINLQWGLERLAKNEDGLILAQSNGSNHLRAVTSTTYGRIWDSQVVDAIIKVNQNGRWVIPAASYASKNPKRATTLYASDRDVFCFLVDDKNVIEVGNEKLYRGFIVWNSEVGTATFGMTTFLYRFVCDNRMIWGATDVKELRIRHTGGAPERFAREGKLALERFANESPRKIIDAVAKAQDMKVPTKVDQSVEQWLQERGFTKSEADASVTQARAEEGEARTVWQVINGVTAFARSIPNSDARTVLEKKAGDLMRYAE